MKQWHSNYTGRIHRTMRDAFNPYCQDVLYPMPDNRPGLVARLLAYLFGR